MQPFGCLSRGAGEKTHTGLCTWGGIGATPGALSFHLARGRGAITTEEHHSQRNNSRVLTIVVAGLFAHALPRAEKDHQIMINSSAATNPKIVLLAAAMLLVSTSITLSQGGGAAGGGAGSSTGGGTGGGVGAGGAGGSGGAAGAGGLGTGGSTPTPLPSSPSAQSPTVNPSSPNTAPQQSSTPVTPSTPGTTPAAPNTASSGGQPGADHHETPSTTTRSGDLSVAKTHTARHHHRPHPIVRMEYSLGSFDCTSGSCVRISPPHSYYRLYGWYR
jgi:hypothetical protein